jgi:hypothetical protein
MNPRRGGDRRELVAQALALLALALGFEALFLRHGLGWFDEAWPLYAAQRLHAGGRLYDDVFFLFPPGHLLPAWIATAVAPPGIVLARGLYAALGAAGVVALYFLARRMMSPPFAFLAGGLLALAAPESHLVHLLFGHRYLVFGALSLLFFARYLDTRRTGFMVLAGVWAGVALDFRLSPAFAVSGGIAVALLASERDLRALARAGFAFVAGLVLAAGPVLAWLAYSVGLPVVWQELVVRLFGLQWAQELPLPPLVLAEASRDALSAFFVALQFRVYPLVVLGVLGGLCVRWLRAGRRLRHDHVLLLAVCVWAGLYLVRVLGRADDHHLYSCLPPVCLLLAAVADRGHQRVRRWLPPGLRAAWLSCGALLLAWVLLMGSDRYLSPARRGTFEVRSASVELNAKGLARGIDRTVETLKRWAGPDDTILSVSLTPIFYVLSDRLGPGYFDVLMRGTFLDPAEERSFVDRLAEAPPSVVVRTVFDEDFRENRLPKQVAPQLWAWILAHYTAIEAPRRGIHVLVHNDRLADRDAE